MATTLQDKLRAKRALAPISMRRPLRTAVGASAQDIADEVARLLTEEAGTPQSCSAAAVLLWESGKRQPRGSYLIAYSRVLDELRRAAS